MNIPVCKSELLLFDNPSTQVSMSSARWADIHPLNSVRDGSGPIEFAIQGSEELYLDLNDTSIYVKFKISPTDTTKPYVIGDYAPVNNILSSLFSDVELSVNNTMVEGGSFLYPYQSYLTNLLNYSSEVKEECLVASGWYMDDAEKFDLKENRGHMNRSELLAKDGTVEVMGSLNLSFLQQSKYLLPKLNVKIKLSRSKDTFCLLNYSNKKVQLSIEECILYVRKVKVNPIVYQAHLEGLNHQNALYPYQKVKISSYTIAKGSSADSREILISSSQPKLMIISMVSNTAMNGNMKKNPFRFRHFGLNFIGLYSNGESIPTPPIHLDVEQGSYVRAYMHMVQNLEHFSKDVSNGVSPKDFIGGSMVFAYNFTPDLNYNGGQMHQNSNLRLDLKFTKPLDESINVIMYTLNDGVLEITKNREVVLS